MTGAYGDPPASGAYTSGAHPAPYPGASGPATAYPAPPPPGAQHAVPAGEGHPDVGDISVGDLIGNVTRDLSTLMRQELALAQAEVKQEVSKTAKGAAAMSGAGVAGYFVLLFLSIALWWALGDAMDSWAWSAVIVAAIWAIVAAVLALRGRAESKRVAGLPKTAESVKKIPNALQGHEEKNS